MPQPCFLALERDAVQSGADSTIWRAPSAAAALSLREALGLAGPHNFWPVERPLVSVSAPTEERFTGEPTDCMLAALLGPTEKRCLELIGDWPWLRLDHLAALLGVGRVRLRELLGRSSKRGLIVRRSVLGRPRLALSDRGLALLARRDRASVGEMRKRWSPEPSEPAARFGWRNVKGTRSRQLLRNLAHTEAVHGFLAALAEQASSNGMGLTQLAPPHRASRYFRYDDRLRSIQPDAFGVLRCDGREKPFFLEWERRAIRPSTMAARIAPYLRYYRANRPVEDHGAIPLVLVVFEDKLAADHFLRVAREEQTRNGVNVPLFISDRDSLAMRGPLGPIWRTTNRLIAGSAFA